MPLTPHDLRILNLASRDVEGRLGFHLTEDGSIAVLAGGTAESLPGEDSFPRLEDLGLMTRAVRWSYVLTPEGWEVVMQAGAEEKSHALTADFAQVG